MSELGDEAKSQTAHVDHARKLPRYRVPRTAFDRALHAATETPYTTDRDGRHHEMMRVLQFRATIGQIRHWRAGRRRVPEWAIQELKKRLEAKQQQASDGLAGLR